MSYTALYRKFRPTTFDEVVGQEHITKTLKNEIIAGRIGHAYLFNGSRGTGKTSVAKIMARAINCLNPKDGEPCNECEICKASLSGSLTDIVEMDAASNNSVDDIRAIRDEVNFLPALAKYRVYIIDEVHMLSTGAFNALLKTLEEPPAHVKFILATTEPQKLPATILSRCQRFDFKRISKENIVKKLKVICKEDNINISDSALNIIAVLSEGALRDAISILERCIQDSNNGIIDENKIRDLVGIPKLELISKISKGILEKDVHTVIEAIEDISTQGKDLDNFLLEIVKYIKDILVYKVTNKLDLYSDEDLKSISSLANSTSKEQLISLIYDLSKLANDMKFSTSKSIIFETGLLKECLEIIPIEVKPRVQSNINVMSEVYNPVAKPVIPVKEEPKGITKSTKEVKPNISTSGNSLEAWPKIMENIKKDGKMMIYANLLGTTAIQVNDQTVEIHFSKKMSDFAKKVFEEHENKNLIEKFISMECGNPMNIRFVENDTTKNTKGKKNEIENIAEELDIPFNVIDG